MPVRMTCVKITLREAALYLRIMVAVTKKQSAVECKNTIQANAYGMQCESCVIWFYLEPCCNINHVKYGALGDNNLLDVILWFCKKCDKSIIQRLKAVA